MARYGYGQCGKLCAARSAQKGKGSQMLTGNESENDLNKMEAELTSAIEKLRGSERREKESQLEDIRSAKKKLKQKGKNDNVKY